MSLEKILSEESEKELKRISNHYQYWNDFFSEEKNKDKFNQIENFDFTKETYHKFLDDCKDYMNLRSNEDREVRCAKFNSNSISEYQNKVKKIDQRRKSKHDNLMTNLKIVNRLLYKNLGDEIIKEDSVGIYPSKPDELYKNLPEDLLEGKIISENRK
ncbi:MAG: DUF3232 domain-containing protein, partial [Candidatus Woesearchaeota archaeon]